MKQRNKINSSLGLSKNPKTHHVLQVILTFALVLFGWVFFRANNTGDAITVLKNMFAINESGIVNLFRVQADFSIALISIGLLFLVEIFEERVQLYEKLTKLSRPYKWIILIMIILAVFIFGMWEAQDFLYFQF